MFLFQTILLNVSDIDLVNGEPFPLCRTRDDLIMIYEGSTMLDGLCHSNPYSHAFITSAEVIDVKFTTNWMYNGNGFKLEWRVLGIHSNLFVFYILCLCIYKKISNICTQLPSNCCQSVIHGLHPICREWSML